MASRPLAASLSAAVGVVDRVVEERRSDDRVEIRDRLSPGEGLDVADRPAEVAHIVMVAMGLSVPAEHRLEPVVRSRTVAEVTLPGDPKLEMAVGHVSSVPVSTP